MVHCIIRSVLVVSSALLVYSSLLWMLLDSQPELPHYSEQPYEEEQQYKPRLYFPTTVPELQKLVTVLRQYHDSHFLYVLLLFSAAYVYKQTFAIPGSALMNVLGGALLGVRVAIPLVCVLTAVGASCCYLLSRASVGILLQKYQQYKVDKLRNKVERHSNHSLFLFLVSLRVFPGTPNWFLNMAAPVAGVPLRLFFPSVFIGLAPYNSLCVLAGASVSKIHSLTDLWSGGSLATLLLLAGLALAGSRFIAGEKSAIQEPPNERPTKPSTNQRLKQL